MPIYEYRCESCEKDFESFHSRMDEEPEECPDCGKLSERISHLNRQHINKPEYVPPPKARKVWGEKNKMPPRPNRWI